MYRLWSVMVCNSPQTNFADGFSYGVQGVMIIRDMGHEDFDCNRLQVERVLLSAVMLSALFSASHHSIFNIQGSYELVIQISHDNIDGITSTFSDSPFAGFQFKHQMMRRGITSKEKVLEKEGSPDNSSQ